MTRYFTRRTQLVAPVVVFSGLTIAPELASSDALCESTGLCTSVGDAYPLTSGNAHAHAHSRIAYIEEQASFAMVNGQWRFVARVAALRQYESSIQRRCSTRVMSSRLEVGDEHGL